ncbi:MAG: 50S ribosomal protein L3 [Elusimicrobia bacterium HGW-Elusimicrobia-1]|jgi:large subunit ribosomal protein L3|nr:MAG: 50S ribosomal protein L3 [Elusimicrobia bacterium HGW-Elusimicrobia-1]
MKILIGKKLSMTQIFDESGTVTPVTVVQAGPCYITAIKTVEKDGYSAVQLGFEEITKAANAAKSYAGIFGKKNIPTLRHLREFRAAKPEDIAGFEQGKVLSADVFAAGDFVDVTGTSKGHGFSGVMKRHNFSGQPASHGASDRERAPGSSGRQQPQRVIKGTKKPGHFGVDRVTIQRLEIMGVDKENNKILVKGAIAGPSHGTVYLKNTVKRIKKKVAPVASKKKVTVEKKKK